MADVRLALDGQTLRVYPGIFMREALAAVGSGAWSKRNGCWEFPVGAVLDVIRALRRESANILAQEPVHALAKQLVANERWLAGVKAEWQERVRCKMTDVPKDQWPDTLPPHPFLMYHQRMGAEIADRFNSFALFNDTGRFCPAVQQCVVATL